MLTFFDRLPGAQPDIEKLILNKMLSPLKILGLSKTFNTRFQFYLIINYEYFVLFPFNIKNFTHRLKVFPQMWQG